MRRIFLLASTLALVLLGTTTYNIISDWLAPDAPVARPALPAAALPTTAPAPAPGAAAVPSGAAPPPAVQAPAPAAPGKSLPPPAPAPNAAASRPEAEGLVRQYFGAFAAGDYDRLRTLTTGTARETTEALIQSLQEEERNRHVQLRVQFTRQEITGVAQSPAMTVVDTSMAADIVARVGPLERSVASLSGNAGFVIQRVGGALAITQITGDLGQ